MNIENWIKKTLKYLERVAIATSILLNVILGGVSNQTFSARNYRWQQEGKWNIAWLIDIIVFWDKYHCFHSWVYYKTTRDLRKSYKEKNNKQTDPLKYFYESQE